MVSFWIKLTFQEADFRVADERGWSPVKQLIVPEDKTLDHSLACPLPLQKIRDELVKLGYPVELSTDPGRFVCNWI